ncbi:MAG: S-methyl-5-thioribose-1-phosphate isomerase [Lachnospiraceae bacterium]|nr:S-methyl-5-thioribose-1-phosphate isomerase [Lachnospiraceae bacterium]
MMQYLTTDHVKFNETKDKVIILDQAALPNRVEYLELSKEEDMYDAIYKLKVRGAPCIGIFAGYAIACLAKQMKTSITETGEKEQYHSFYNKFRKAKDYLNSSRPTAVNLSWALNRMEKVVTTNENQSLDEIIKLLEEEAVTIHEEDIKMCLAIAENGLKLVKDGDGILTHCNAGPLATSRYGTALGPILLGKEKGINLKVFSDETRPLLQGARLTSYELKKASVDVTLICDNMASIVMKNGWIQACFVGCDRIAANGDAANKIGTSGVAILAKHYHIPFYVLGPTSTIDCNCKTGKDITIELRNPEEIKEKFYKEPMALNEVKCYNPAFDVTDHELITAIITDKGIFYPPYHFA